MSNSNSDDYIKAGADILLKGGKMLGKACPNCISPLYSFKGKVYCVKCKQEFVLVDSPSEIPVSQKNTLPSQQMKQTPPSYSPNMAETARIIEEKIAKLNVELQETSDLNRIKEISVAIKSLVETLKSLS